jgi:excisionase family DNA binding protein
MSVGQHSQQPPRFYTVHQAAAILGTSTMTLYRSIAANEFPAVRVRNRIIIPARAIDEMEAAAVERRGIVDASGWATVARDESVDINPSTAKRSRSRD